MDLLVFGPHPDDIEIGIAGIVARHAAEGAQVGLCDLTGGEMGSNGTVPERIAEGEAARKVLGAAWRENLGWPDREIGKDPGHLEQAASFVRRHRPKAVAIPYWSDRHPDHVAASEVLTEAIFNAGLRRYTKAEGEAWKPDWICYYFLNNAVEPSFVVDVTSYYEAEAAGARLPREPVPPDQVGRAHTAQHSAVPPADREPGRAVRRPGRRAVGGGNRRPRAACLRAG